MAMTREENELITRVSDGVHLTLNALEYLVESVLVPAVNDAQSNYP